MLVIMSVDVVQDHMRARKLLFLVGSFILTFLENRLPFISLRQSSIVAAELRHMLGIADVPIPMAREPIFAT